jgi:hypothetical protein
MKTFGLATVLALLLAAPADTQGAKHQITHESCSNGEKGQALGFMN